MMFKVESRQNGDTLHLKFEGRVDELVDFEKTIKAKSKDIHVNCRNVTRINSIGVGAWRKYFHKLRCDSVKLRFVEISPVLVDQMNYIRGFIELHEIESVCIPFECPHCKVEVLLPQTLANIRAIYDQGSVSTQCPTCKQTLEFGDSVEDYLNFLEG